MITQYIRIEINKELDQSIHSVQYDSRSRYVQFHIFDGGVPMDISNCKVYMCAVKPDGNIIFHDCKIIDSVNGVVEIELTEQLNAVAGDVKCELKLYGPDKELLTTKTFDISVKRSLISELIESSTEVSPLDKRYVLRTEFSESMERVSNQIAELDNQMNPLSINLTSSVTTAERGSTVNNVKLSWSYNKQIVSQKLNGSVIDVSLRTQTITENITTNKTFTLEATSTAGQIKNKSVSLTFLNGVYYGKSSRMTYDGTLISSLTKVLSDSRSRTITVNAGSGEYIYYCVPERLGDCKFKVGGFDGGFSKVATIDFTNNSNYTERYAIWKSDNENLGNTTIVIS